MSAISNCIEDSASGCFESPTGTGKSLSVICSTLQWLNEEEKTIIESINKASSATAGDDDDWLSDMLDNAQSNNKSSYSIGAYESFIRRLAVVRQSSHSAMKKTINSRNDTKSSGCAPSPDDEFLLKHYDSGDESAHSRDGETRDDCENFSELALPQIFYCTRTHSQIAQFVSEIKKTAHKNMRCVTLGSRRNLCVNPAVKNIQSDALMNEKCLDMQKQQSSTAPPTDSAGVSTASKSKKLKVAAQSCSFRNRSGERQLADFNLAQVRDLEDVVAMAVGGGGDGAGACPYYAARSSIAAAQLVCMPYNMLLQKEIRESLGISLRGKVVVIDEAHNFLDAISAANSAEVCGDQLETALTALSLYFARYQTVLSGKNVYYMRLFESVLRKLRRHLLSSAEAPAADQPAQPQQAVLRANDFLFRAGLDNVNMFKLVRYLSASSLAQKVAGFSARHLLAAQGEAALPADGSRPSHQTHAAAKCDVLAANRAVMALLRCLTNADEDGRLLVGAPGGGAPTTVRYLLLNPAAHFRPIAEQARSVVLLGGTMQPFSFFSAALFPGRRVAEVDGAASGALAQDAAAVRLFACGHVVDPSHVKALVVCRGPGGAELQFTADRRLSVETVGELHRTLLHICGAVPGGVVVFFTSYSYLNAVVARWRGGDGLLLRQLEALKPVFVEVGGAQRPGRGVGSSSVWEAYQQEFEQRGGVTAAKGRGAVLLSVMGGSLSEGINFSDDLARCVVVVGMPYPDQRDVVFQERVRFASQQQRAADAVSLQDAVCMKAVNQSIGRSVRHAADYASIVLLDRRYAQERIRRQLPGWIAQQVQCMEAPFSCSERAGSSESLSEFHTKFVA